MAIGSNAAFFRLEVIDVQDLLWIGLMLVLLAASLAYVALCNKA
jgi:hypothetical protein